MHGILAFSAAVIAAVLLMALDLGVRLSFEPPLPLPLGAGAALALGGGGFGALTFGVGAAGVCWSADLSFLLFLMLTLD